MRKQRIPVPIRLRKLPVENIATDEGEQLVEFDKVLFVITYAAIGKQRVFAGWVGRLPLHAHDIIVRTEDGVYRLVKRRKRKSLAAVKRMLPEQFQRVHHGVLVNVDKIVWYGLKLAIKKPWVAFEVTPPTPTAPSRETIFVSDQGRKILLDVFALQGEEPPDDASSPSPWAEAAKFGLKIAARRAISAAMLDAQRRKRKRSTVQRKPATQT